MRRSAWRVILCLLSSGCWWSGKSSDKDRPIVARINGNPIYLDDFRKDFQRIRLDDEEGAIPSAATMQVQISALLDDQIERRLLLEEAERNHVVVGIDEVEAAYERVRAGWDDQEIGKVLEGKDLTAAELKRELREILMIQKLLREHVNARIAVTDDEINAYIEAHPESQLLPEAVHALHIVVKTEEKAKEIQEEIGHGLSFADAAAKYSLSPEGKSGGDLGFFTRGAMPAVFDEVCFSLKPGEVSKVVASDLGFHLFKVIERRPESLKPVAGCRREVEEILRHEKEQAAHDAKVAELKQKAEIIVFDKELARVY